MNNKVVIGLVAVFILGLGLYFFLGRPATPEDAMMEDGDKMMVENGEKMGKDDAMMADDEEAVQEFDLVGTSFKYDVTEISVKKGDTVKINLLVEEGFHDWVVDEFDAATEQMGVGKTTSVTFMADQVGTFEYYCSVGSHRAQGMVGTLTVTE